MHILIAGLNQEDNQISRKLKKTYNCKISHTTGDHGAFPTNADAVIVVKAQISHGKYDAVVQSYKGKKIFVTRDGFTRIQEEFHAFMKEHNALKVEVEAENDIVDRSSAPSDPLDLIDEVLTSSASTDKKLDIITKIRNGEIRSLEYTTCKVERGSLVLARGNHIDSERSSGIVFDKKGAEIAVFFAKEIQAFAEGRL